MIKSDNATLAARVKKLLEGQQVGAYKAFIKLSCKSQFPHKPVNLSFIIADIKSGW